MSDQPLRTTGAMNNSSSFSVQETSSPLLITYVNISMTIVALATLSHISALFTLFRDRRLRRKIMSPFMINISVISLVLSIGGYAVTLGTDFKRQTRNNTQAVYLCNWVTFVGLLSKNAFLSTLCAMNIVSKLASDRCTRGVAQQITRKSNIIIFSASWLYSILMSVPINFEDSLSALSASQLTCNLNWTSREKLHFLYNALVAITTLLLPMVICFAMQYHCARIWRVSRYTQDMTRRRRLVYRRKLNRMVVALTVLFFIFEFPCQVGNLFAMATGYYSFTHRVGFSLEMVSQCSVLYPPWVYLFLNASYRTTLKQLLTDTPRQRTTNFRENALRGNERQGTASRNRGTERARVRFNNQVSSLPQPATPSRQTNGNTQASGTTSLRSKTNAGSTGNNNEDQMNEEQSTDF